MQHYALCKVGPRVFKGFRKKVQCETYATKTEQEFKEAGRELVGGKNDILYTTERVFYSSKRNSCICMLRAFYVVKGKGFYDILTIDALTKEDLGSRSYSGDEGNNIAKDVEDKVKSLE